MSDTLVKLDPTVDFGAWLSNRIHSYYDGGKVSGYSFHITDPNYSRLTDAVQNRNFEALKNSSRVTGLKLNGLANGLVEPEFELFEMAAVFDAEPYVRKAITRQLNLWFKQGFNFVGENSSYINYINKRFRQIAYVSGIPTVDLFKTVVRSLLKFSNAFVIKVRDANLSGGFKKEGRPAPVAGYFPVSPLRMYPYYDNGKLIKWIRFTNDNQRYQEYKVEDVIHFTFDREEDFLFGKPRLLGVVEDIAALRRIEENLEVLIVKHLFPFFHFKVGNEQMPCQYYPNGSSEIDVAKAMLEGMEQEGMLVTSERFELLAVGAENKSLDVSNYLQHFKMRLFAGLGVSPIDMGEGDTANRSTADSISQNLKDLIVEDQKYFAAQVQHFMISELFLEHPDDVSALNAYDTVNISFAEVDLDNLIKMQNHIINLFNNNLISEDEARLALNRVPMSESQRQKTHFSLIEVPSLIISASDEPFTSEAKKAVKARTDPNAVPAPGTGGNTKSRTGGKGKKKVARPGTPASRPVAVISQPTNQHGTNLGPTKRKSSLESEIVGEELSNLISVLLISTDNFEEVINMRFTNHKDEVLSAVKRAYESATDKHELRSALVAELIYLKDKIEANNETNQD
jgi:hypothetical protein